MFAVHTTLSTSPHCIRITYFPLYSCIQWDISFYIKYTLAERAKGDIIVTCLSFTHSWMIIQWVVIITVLCCMMEYIVFFMWLHVIMWVCKNENFVRHFVWMVISNMRWLIECYGNGLFQCQFISCWHGRSVIRYRTNGLFFQNCLFIVSISFYYACSFRRSFHFVSQ